MLIDEAALIALIKSNLPNAGPETCSAMAKDITRDAEAIIRSMIRRMISNERKQRYQHDTSEKTGPLRP